MSASLFMTLLLSNGEGLVPEHRKSITDFMDSSSDEVHISRTLDMCALEPLSM